jgi:hypothetical protein
MTLFLENSFSLNNYISISDRIKNIPMYFLYFVTIDSFKNLDEVKAFAPFDAVVTMGCGDACPWMPAKQFMDWQIPDPKHMEPKEFNEVRDFIKTKVEELLNALK